MTTEEQLKKRLALIEDDLRVIREFIYIQGLTSEFDKSTPYSEEAWVHLNNIDIACDLSSDECLTWRTFTNYNEKTRTL